MIIENLENRPLLTPIAYPIRVGSGSGSGRGSGSGSWSGILYMYMKPSLKIPTPTPTPPPTPTTHSYRVGNGSKEWAIFKVSTDHFAHFSFSTSYIKS